MSVIDQSPLDKLLGRNHGIALPVEIDLSDEREAELVASGHGVISIMDPVGDFRLIWDKDNPDEVQAARTAYETLTSSKKFAGFDVTAGGDKGKQIRAFDPNIEKLIMVPPFQGG